MNAPLPDIERISAALHACRGYSTEQLKGRNFRLERMHDVLDYSAMLVRFYKALDGLRALGQRTAPVDPQEMRDLLAQVGDE